VPGPSGQTISSQHADTAYHNSLVELGKKLLACAKEGDTEGVRLLMSRGAPFTTDWLGTSPLHLTAMYGKVDTCEVLLRAGCSRDARTKVDKTPLHVASQEGHTEICELLLSQGADVDARDMLRMTPLHWAVERGCTQTVELLLKHGANTNIESKFDKTALEIASENGRPDIFEILQNADQFRVLAIDSGDSGGGGQLDPGMVVSQQEVVQTEVGVQLMGHSVGVDNSVGTNTMHFIKQDRESQNQNNLQFIKSELENLDTEGLPLQIALDPIQIALNSVGEGMEVEDNSSQYFTPLSSHPSSFTATTFTESMSVTGDITADSISSMPLISSMTDTDLSSLCSTPSTPQDEAIKLLASHGITMLPEDPPLSPQSLSLTEAGKLALSLTSKVTPISQSTTILPRPISQPTSSPRSISLSVPKSMSNPTSFPSLPKVTKIVTLNSTPVKPDPPIAINCNNRMDPPKPLPTPITFPKPPRVIKLTAAQFAAIKKGRAGQIVLPAIGQNKRETITLASHLGGAGKREGSPATTTTSSPIPKKIIRLETPDSGWKQNSDDSSQFNNIDNEKIELQKQLQRQLEQKAEETEKLKEEMKKREQEAERIKAQLKALSS